VPPIKDTPAVLQELSKIESTTATTASAAALTTSTLTLLTSPTPETLSPLKSTLQSLLPTFPSFPIKQTYLTLDALRTLLAALKHIEQQSPKALPKSEIEALRKQADEGVAKLQAYAKERARKVSGQSVRGGFGKEGGGGVWGMFDGEELGSFAGRVADAEGQGWEGVGRVK
jgi:hypothetical protein